MTAPNYVNIFMKCSPATDPKAWFAIRLPKRHISLQAKEMWPLTWKKVTIKQALIETKKDSFGYKRKDSEGGDGFLLMLLFPSEDHL